ncbi:MAG: NAD(P)H-hydrate dehydratase [Pseudomonadota bacterium]
MRLEGGETPLRRRLLSAADVRRIDQTAEALSAQSQAGGGVAALMRRAGAAVAAAAERRFGARAGRAAILAGPGANGGDGYVAARELMGAGREAIVLALAPPAPGPAAEAERAWGAAGGAVLSGDDPAAEKAFDEAAYLIDALFGVGLTRPATGTAARWIAAANDAAARAEGPPILSVDIPSGVAVDTGRALGPAIAAAATVTFLAPKRGHRLGEGALLCGEVEVVQIGAPAEALARWPDQTTELAPFLWADEGRDHGLGKPVDAHKYDHGAALIASGGRGASGAARLAARACLRIGAGLATVAAPEGAMAECAAQLTAVMLREAETPDAFAELLEDRRINAVLLGPGHGAHPGGAARSRAFIETLLGSEAYRAGRRLAVLDADALTCWPEPARLFEALALGAAVVTPHGGEFARLFPDLGAALADPAEAARFGKIEACRAAASRAGAVVLLKGFDTVVAAPEGRAAVQTAAGARAAPWLATAGSGDALAGLILGLGARGFAAFEAAAAGAWLHLEAGRRAGPGLIAEDLPEAITAALRGGAEA